MSSNSLLSFNDASATSLAEVFDQKAALVRAFIPDVRDSITSAVGDWTGESRTACDAALKRLEERGEELAALLTSASHAMEEIRDAGTHAEAKAFACIDS